MELRNSLIDQSDKQFETSNIGLNQQDHFLIDESNLDELIDNVDQDSQNKEDYELKKRINQEEEKKTYDNSPIKNNQELSINIEHKFVDIDGQARDNNNQDLNNLIQEENKNDIQPQQARDDGSCLTIFINQSEQSINQSIIKKDNKNIPEASISQKEEEKKEQQKESYKNIYRGQLSTGQHSIGSEAINFSKQIGNNQTFEGKYELSSKKTIPFLSQTFQPSNERPVELLPPIEQPQFQFKIKRNNDVDYKYGLIGRKNKTPLVYNDNDLYLLDINHGKTKEAPIQLKAPIKCYVEINDLIYLGGVYKIHIYEGNTLEYKGEIKNFKMKSPFKMIHLNQSIVVFDNNGLINIIDIKNTDKVQVINAKHMFNALINDVILIDEVFDDDKKPKSMGFEFAFASNGIVFGILNIKDCKIELNQDYTLIKDITVEKIVYMTDKIIAYGDKIFYFVDKGQKQDNYRIKGCNQCYTLQKLISSDENKKPYIFFFDQTHLGVINTVTTYHKKTWFSFSHGEYYPTYYHYNCLQQSIQTIKNGDISQDHYYLYLLQYLEKTDDIKVIQLEIKFN